MCFPFQLYLRTSIHSFHWCVELMNSRAILIDAHIFILARQSVFVHFVQHSFGHIFPQYKPNWAKTHWDRQFSSWQHSWFHAWKSAPTTGITQPNSDVRSPPYDSSTSWTPWTHNDAWVIQQLKSVFIEGQSNLKQSSNLRRGRGVGLTLTSALTFSYLSNINS